ncbi:YkvA family protein [Phytohabitans flavus]|uniref:Membrane protein n=1 Tax=Phytohabitans flavus TaxID=1076124 RepID=A0A6F8XUV9_9ACTN|nr:YkvA family protein [Phytohabitans flavus]BCB77616.1 membrane protein [Phytohabitans flavus]
MSREAWTVVIVLGVILAVATLIGALVLAVRVWRTRKLLGQLGAGGKVAFYGALLYTILPVDLLPDPIYLDDMGLLTGALLYLTHLVRKQRATSSEFHPPVPAERRR